MRTHFGGGGVLKLDISMGSSKLMFCAHVKDGAFGLTVFLALWRGLKIVTGKVCSSS